MGGAPLDDELMFRAANHITAGQWLGAYDYLTLSKAMFFPVWLALLHALHLPYLISGRRSGAGGAAGGVCLSTLWRKDSAQGRVLTLALFAALAFLPSSWRPTRCAFTATTSSGTLPVLFCGHGGHGAARGVHAGKAALAVAGRGGRGPGLRLPHREDAGLFLLPFAAAATVIVAVVLVGKRRWKALAEQVIPYAMLGVGVLTFCTLNYTHTTAFALSDFSEGSFAAAMGAMMRVDTDSTAPYLRAR